MARKADDEYADVPTHPGWARGKSRGVTSFEGGDRAARSVGIAARAGGRFDLTVRGERCPDRRAASFPHSSSFSIERAYALDLLRRQPEEVIAGLPMSFEAVEKGFSLDPSTGLIVGGPLSPGSGVTLQPSWSMVGSPGGVHVAFSRFPLGYTLYIHFDPRVLGVRSRFVGPLRALTGEMSNVEGVASIHEEAFFALPPDVVPELAKPIALQCQACGCDDCGRVMHALGLLKLAEEMTGPGETPAAGPAAGPAAYKPDDGPDVILFPTKRPKR